MEIATANQPTIETVISVLALIVSIVAIIFSYRANRTAHALAANANAISGRSSAIQMGQAEIQIREMISNAWSRHEDLYSKKISGSLEVDDDLLESVLEGVCSAYDEACAKYLDGKVDKERFRKNYRTEIRQLVEDTNTKEKYLEPQTKYQDTVKVYREWNNVE